MSRTYIETFDEGCGGWMGWISNSAGPKSLEHHPGVVTSRSPWWIDYNHAPPGGGYLHMLFCTATRGPIAEHYAEVGGLNRLVTEQYPTDYTGARFTLNLRGELRERGARLVLLAQGTVGRMTSTWVMTGQPIEVGSEWEEQTICAVPDLQQWSCIGGRHDRTDYYGYVDLETILSDVSGGIMFVLFPLTIEPMGEIDGDPHLLRPGKDYPVWQSSLPEGYVELDTVRIDFAREPG